MSVQPSLFTDIMLTPRFARRFTGIEFAVVHAQPPSMFIIHKRERLSPDEGSRLVVIDAFKSVEYSVDCLH